MTTNKKIVFGEPEWEVYFENPFYGWHRGHDKPGIEIPVSKTFTWGGRTWHIPAVYSCGKGLVVDFCVEIDPVALHPFLEKWNPLWEEDRPLTREEEEQQNAENPMRIDFNSKAKVNGRELRFSRGSDLDWVPMSCRPEGRCWNGRDNSEAVRLMEHYGLNAEVGWVFFRQSFLWTTSARPKLNTLSISLEQRRQAIPGLRFTVGGVGDKISFTNPFSGKTHTLHILKYENQEADLSGFPVDDFECPTHYVSMSYFVEPDLPRELLSVRDFGRGDSPRSKKQSAGGCALAFVTNDEEGDSWTACSALRFEKPKQIEWQILFFQKTAEDMEIDLPLLKNRQKL